MNEQSVPQLEEIEAMFVQCAHGLTTSDGTQTFQGPAHATLFYADRPQRVVGHMPTRKFVNEWGDGENSFAEDPPNAVVSFLEEGDACLPDFLGRWYLACASTFRKIECSVALR